MDNVPILKCPLAKESGFSIAIVPAYFLTDGSPELIRGDVLGVRVPEGFTKEVRRIHRLGEEQGWKPLIMLTCMIEHCSRCIPGVSWSSKDPCFYMVPTDIQPGQIDPESSTLTMTPQYIEP